MAIFPQSRLSLTLILLSVWLGPVRAAKEEIPTEASPQAQTFFESKIRPVLVEHCYECHSAKAQTAKMLKGGLLLDTREGIRKGGESGPAVVPGKPDESLLLSAVKHKSFEMPPKGKLSNAIISDLETWIQSGAFDPRDGTATVEKTTIDIESGRDFWAFRPLADAVPPANSSAWPRTEIDQFVWRTLEQKQLKPQPDANPRDLARRLYFDLVGLPPTPTQIERFVADAQKDRESAIENLVDQLLASPRFGERWGRHWLDVARYGESNGGTKNTIWLHAWRYRDYVIHAFNTDKPYSQFLREQLAGDLLPAGTEEQRLEQLIATGFLGMGSKANDTTRMEIIGEQLDVLGRAMLGISIGCARCHDHKFDPVPTRDFYALAGILQNTAILDGKPFASPDPKTAKIEAKTFKEFERAIASATRLVEQQTDRLEELAAEQNQRLRPGETWENVIERFPDQGRRKKAEETLQSLIRAEKTLKGVTEAGPPDVKFSVGVMDRAAKGRNWLDARIHIRGSDSNLGEEVPRGFMQVLYRDDDPLPSIGAQESGRLQLANIISQHPLPARVMVNRIWHHLFGCGLVKTVDNFGTLGERPSHPELLEWLANRFVEDDGSIKNTIRRIVLSRTYQLSARVNEANHDIDPESRYFWRHTPRRLDAEAIRDAILSSSGSLILEPPNAFDNYAAAIQMTDITATGKSHRRAVYLPSARGFTPDLLDAFNFPPADLVVGRRETPSVPTQALFMMNSRLVSDHSQLMAQRLLTGDKTDDERITQAWELTLGREPGSEEVAETKLFLQEFQSVSQLPPKTTRQDAWAALCQSLFASVEFRFLR